LDLRERLNVLLDETDQEKLKAFVDDILDLKKKQWAYCPNCSEKVYADFPDRGGQIKAFQILLDQGKGKPAETVKHTGQVTLKAISEMSDAELAREIENASRELPGA